MHDLTATLRSSVRDSELQMDVTHGLMVGSTGVLETNEFEPGLEQDLPEILDRLMPRSRAPGHEPGHEKAWHDGNARSHLQATVLDPSLSLPIAAGRPVLGTWQQIFHLECDVKPRTREIVVTLLGTV